MTDPVCEQVADAFADALAAISTISGLAVERDRDVEVTNFPTLVVLVGDQEADEGAGNNATLYRMKVEVEGYAVPASAGDPVSKAANALYAAMLAAVMADPTLGGKCVNITEGATERARDRVEGHGPLGMFRTAFEIEFFTVSSDPYTQAAP